MPERNQLTGKGLRGYKNILSSSDTNFTLFIFGTSLTVWPLHVLKCLQDRPFVVQEYNLSDMKSIFFVLFAVGVIFFYFQLFNTYEEGKEPVSQ